MNASVISKIIVILCALCLIAGILNIDKHEAYLDEGSQKQNKNIITNSNKVAVIELNGAIASSAESSFFSADANAAGMLKSLKLAKEDKDVKGIILKINSPGGTVAMSQNIYNQIIKIRENKPVISVLDDVAASGGYYIASASDRIVAQEGTLTGSIGVIFSFMDYHNLLINKLDVNQVVIKSGKFKDIGSGMREMTQEERSMMQEVINDSYYQFLTAIKHGRIDRNDNYQIETSKLTIDNLKRYADGRVFTGKKAKALGFVDIIGDMDSAKSAIEIMAQQKFNNKLKAKLVNYNRKPTLGDYFSDISEYGAKSNIKLTDFMPLSMILSKRPLYLWE